MKLLIYSDNHWCQYSSIVRKRGSKYSCRLENQIQSLNWVMSLAEETGCWSTWCLGDFFDKSELNSEEISALKEIKWAPMTNSFVAGNHEMGIANHDYSSVKLFNLLDTGDVITKPQLINCGKDYEIAVLPYILECDRQPLETYFTPRTDKKRILFSHNDIKGIQMGAFKSQEGFSIEEIEANCDICINGHLHNGFRVSRKIINIGNLTGQNFSEDAFSYDHCAFVLDTDTLHVDVYENPYAYNFYKIDTNTASCWDFSKLKNNAVITLKCCPENVQGYKELISNSPNISESRILVVYDTENISESIEESLSVNHLQEFQKYILSEVGTSDLIQEELQKVCG